MNAKIIAVFGIMAAFAYLQSPVQAQSSSAPSPNSGNYSLNGDSLVNINNRNAQKDFGIFFDQENLDSTSSNSDGNNTTTEEVRFQQSLSFPDSPIFLQPAQSVNGNDGLQLQLDLGNAAK